MNELIEKLGADCMDKMDKEFPSLGETRYTPNGSFTILSKIRPMLLSSLETLATEQKKKVLEILSRAKIGQDERIEMEGLKYTSGYGTALEEVEEALEREL